MWINLDQLLDLPNVTIVNYKKIDDIIFIKLSLVNETIECPNCHRILDTINQTENSLRRDLPIAGSPVYLEVPRRQFYCPSCDKYTTERVGFIKARKNHTIRYEEMIYERVKRSTITAVCEEEGLGWDDVHSIFEEFAKRHEKKVWEYPKRISLDEFSNRKGHKKLITTVVDLENKELLEVIKGHKEEEEMEGLKSQPEEVREKVEEVSVDMWKGFTAVIKKIFPNAKITYDRFHVMKMVNEELNELRKKMNVHKKGLPHLLWKNQNDLNEEQQQSLEEILEEYPLLRIAHEMKEEFREIYERSRKANGAKRKFEKWLRISGIIYQKSANMVRNHLTGICNYFNRHTTNGITEGMNTKIKLIKRMSYGLTNFQNLRLKLFACFNS